MYLVEKERLYRCLFVVRSKRRFYDSKQLKKSAHRGPDSTSHHGSKKGVKPMQKITPFLWFDAQAEEAVKFYTSIFKNSKVGKVLRYDEEAAKISQSGRPPGSVLTLEFQIEGQNFVALNGGPAFKFNDSISFVVNCETQEEVDYFWEKLTADGGNESQCGWLKDKFGLSWQVVPTVLSEMLQDKDPEKAEQVMKAMLQMQKIDINKLKAAYAENDPNRYGFSKTKTSND